MGTTMCMMLLFTQSSRICRMNVGSHAIVFKSLRFGRFTLKHNPQSFQTKTGFKSLGFRLWKHHSSVNDNRSKLWVLKCTSVNGAWVCILFATSNQILIQEPNWTLKCILDPQFQKLDQRWKTQQEIRITEIQDHLFPHNYRLSLRFCSELAVY